MNREIKFRGKRIDNGEWVYGYYVKDANGKSRIYLKPFAEATSNTWFYVNEYSVGQCIGLFDGKGTEIYESDIIEHNATMHLCKVIYKKSISQFLAKEINGDGKVWQLSGKKGLKIIGNTFVNPELLTN